MVKLLLIIPIIFSSCSISKTHSQTFPDAICIDWNRLTFQSLERQARQATDNTQKSLYDNSLLAVKEQWKVKGNDSYNDSSIRYKFLETICSNSDCCKKTFYIIEANESGSKILLRHFIVYTDATNVVNVEFYDFTNSVWHKTGKFKLENFHFKDDLKNYLYQFGKGINNDDIIITKFENCHVKESEYYLYSTLSLDSGIKEILNGYRKENFLK